MSDKQQAPARAIVLVSGGLDSATVLAIAQSRGFDCYALSFDYGQRHRAELDAAALVAAAMGAVAHRVARLDLSSNHRMSLCREFPSRTCRRGIRYS